MIDYEVVTVAIVTMAGSALCTILFTIAYVTGKRVVRGIHESIINRRKSKAWKDLT